VNAGVAIAAIVAGGLLLLGRRPRAGDTLALGRPLDQALVTSGWGDSRDYRATADNPHPKHEGLDLRAATGTPVGAMAAGVVAYVRLEHTGVSGRGVRLSHPNGLTTEYLHLSRVLVRAGQRVSAGELLGLSGSSPARPDVPHLHVTVRANAAALARYRRLYGMPAGGFGSTTRGGTAVPAEPLVRATYTAAVIARASARGVAPPRAA